ncbi:hypothetical protein FB451DRAFT_1567645 [Mycena latifolia]|nr:hypothetical protein FB451DRAFT_1567645 [Mycena latifolia]
MSSSHFLTLLSRAFLPPSLLLNQPYRALGRMNSDGHIDIVVCPLRPFIDPLQRTAKYTQLTGVPNASDDEPLPATSESSRQHTSTPSFVPAVLQRFVQPTPSVWKRALLLGDTVFLLWLTFQIKGARVTPKSGACVEEFTCRPSARPIFTETLKDGTAAHAPPPPLVHAHAQAHAEEVLRQEKDDPGEGTEGVMWGVEGEGAGRMRIIIAERIRILFYLSIAEENITYP